MIPPGGENKVMHSTVRIGDSNVMFSDGNCTGQSKFGGINLSISVSSDVEAQRVFSALSEGGKVTMPLGKTFFSSSFGMLQDKFGVSWMVINQETKS
jgi:PhnB protein